MPPSARRQVTLFFLAILAGSWSAEGAEIRFRPQADVRGSLVLLGDIAEILGTEAETQTVETLRRTRLDWQRRRQHHGQTPWSGSVPRRLGSGPQVRLLVGMICGLRAMHWPSALRW